jgi:pilus assembly protein CpaE
MHGKGGVGTTTLAVNAAVALAMSSKRVSLLDLDLAYGNAARMLGLQSQRTLADLAADDRVSVDALHDLTVKHPSGVKVVTGCDQPEHASTVGGLLVRWTIEQQLEQSDVVLVDTATWLNEATLAVLPEATTVCVVTTPRLVALEATAACLDVLERLGVGRDRAKLVLNNTASRGLKSEAVVKRLERQVDLTIPFLPSFVDAARALRPLDLGHSDQVGAIVARDLATRVINFPAA